MITLSSARIGLVTVAVGVLLRAAIADATTVFSTDFESGVPPGLSYPGADIQPVEGFAGLGAAGNQFAGSFLRYSDTGLVDTTLTLTNLPPHDHVSLGFLLAIIDSWDGTELFEVTIDGDVRFSNWFSLATADESSYDPPAGALLSSGTELGFSVGSFYGRDRAYDLSVEPALQDVPHTGSSLTIVWRVSGVAGSQASFWQGGPDESWAIDNVRVDVSTLSTTTLATTTSSTTSTTSTSSSSSTSSTSTSTTSTINPSTTTLAHDACSGVADGPTFPSILCRLAAEIARVNAASDLGKLQPKLLQTLTKATDRTHTARDVCAGSDVRKARVRLKQVIRALVQYAHRLKSGSARSLDDELRDSFVPPSDAIRGDVKILRQDLRCPDDAEG